MTQRYGIRDIVDCTIKNFTTKKPVLYLSSLKTADLETKVATVYAQGGRGNPKLIGFDSTREETFKVTDALVSPDSLGLLFGSTPATGAVTVNHTEVLTVSAAHTITLSKTPLGTLGADKFFFISSDGANLDTEVVYSATPGTGKYQISSTLVTLYTDITAGTLVVANYDYTTAATAQTIIIDATTFPGTYEITGETFFRGEDGVDYPATVKIYKAKIIYNGTINFNVAGDPTVFGFDVECLKAVGKTNMIDIIIEE